MGLFDKLLGGKRKIEDEYYDALVQLGTVAAQYPPRGARLRTLGGVRQIQQVLESRRLELQMIEKSMEDAEAQAAAEAAAEDAEKPDLQKLVDVHKAAITHIERKIAALKKNLIARQANMKYWDRQLEAQEGKVRGLHEAGEFEKEAAEREILKKVRLDHMRQNSELDLINDEIEIHLKGAGLAGDGMRAKLRLEEIDRNAVDREKELNESLEALDRQATEKEKEIGRTEEALADALAALGEEIYASRFPDPHYQAYYQAVDPLAQALAAKGG